MRECEGVMGEAGEAGWVRSYLCCRSGHLELPVLGEGAHVAMGDGEGAVVVAVGDVAGEGQAVVAGVRGERQPAQQEGVPGQRRAGRHGNARLLPGLRLRSFPGSRRSLYGCMLITASILLGGGGGGGGGGGARCLTRLSQVKDSLISSAMALHTDLWA